MKLDLLSQVLPADQPAVSAAELPPAATAGAADQAATELHRSLDMVQLRDDQREQVGAPSSADEVQLDELYAGATAAAPALLGLIGRAPGAFQHGCDMEQALTFYQQANQGMLQIARSAFLLCAAALTEQNDRAEEAVLAIAQDPAVPAETRVVIENAHRVVNEARAEKAQVLLRQRARKEQRSARLQAQRLLTERRTKERRRLAELAAAPLPETPSPKEAQP